MQRLSDEDLTELLNDIESDRVERKESFGDPKNEKRRYKNIPYDLCHAGAVQDAKKDFKLLAEKISAKIGVVI